MTVHESLVGLHLPRIFSYNTLGQQLRQVDKMRTLRIILFISGIALLFAGFWLQDFSPANRLINALEEPPAHVPSRYCLDSALADVHSQIQFGLVLKLVGLPMLFTLFFWKMHRLSTRNRISMTLPTISGLGSAIFFAIYAVLAPAGRHVEWIIQSLVGREMDSLDAQTMEQLHNAIFGQGISTLRGTPLLAVSLFLLCTALFTYRRKMIGTASIPTVAPAIFQAGARRAVSFEEPPSVFSLMLQESIFCVVTFILSICISVACIWTMITYKRKPRRTLLLTIIVGAAMGCLALVYWMLSNINITNLRLIVTLAQGIPSPADVAKCVFMALASTYFLSITLMVSCLVLPILFALSLREPSEKADKTQGEKRNSTPLIALVMTIAAFSVAGFLGLRENPYMASLRNVSLPLLREWLGLSGESLEKFAEDAARLDSPEGIEFLKKTTHNLREAYWHPLILEYLFEHSKNPKGTEFVLDSLFDEDHPATAAQAYRVVHGAFEIHYGEKGPEVAVLSYVLSYLSHKPEHGARILEIAFETKARRSAFLYGAMKACAEKGVTKFTLHRRRRKSEDYYGYEPELPDGFVLHSGQPDATMATIPVRFRWCNKDNFESTNHPRAGRVVIEVGKKRFGNVTNEFGEELPDYLEFAGDLKKLLETSGLSPDSKRLWVELQVDPLVPAFHIRHVLNACAEAGVMEVSIREP